ncbi:MAG: class I SAM-dependent methyltransferase [Pseudomonadales bacterium]
MNKLALFLFSVILTSCTDTKQADLATEASADRNAGQTKEAARSEAASGNNDEILAAILAKQDDEVIARFAHRHPAETLSFFGIEPGMTVVEALPGGGWYSKILLPYLGASGSLIGVDYAEPMFHLFGFFSAENLEAKKTWAADWTAEAQGWYGDKGADVSAFTFGSQSENTHGTADAVLFVRALHNLARFQPKGDYLTTALQDTYSALKPGGVVGVVQHEAREDMPDAWAAGAAGYLKKAFVIEQFETAGFEFVAESAVNNNPKDQPTVDDIVWRLPPSFSGSKDNPELKAAMQEVGESNRMTLLFKKPS